MGTEVFADIWKIMVLESFHMTLKKMESLSLLLLDYNRLNYFEFSELLRNITRLSLSNNAIKNVSGKLTQKRYISTFYWRPNYIFGNTTILLACYLGNNKLNSVLPPSN